MTGADEELSMKAIEIGRDLGRSLTQKLREEGISQEDATIAAIYSAFDAATDFTGSRINGVEWLRTATDAIERQLLAKQ